MSQDRFAIVDMDAIIRPVQVNLEILQSAVSKIGNPYFDVVQKVDSSIVMKSKESFGIIAQDGTVRLITKDKSIDEARELYRKLVAVLKETSALNIEKITSILKVNLILHYEGKKPAREAIQEFVGPDRVSSTSAVLGRKSTDFGLNVLVSDIGRTGSDERLEFNIDPLMDDPKKYYLRIRWGRRKLEGSEFLSLIENGESRIHEVADEGKKLLDLVDHGHQQISK